MQMDPSNQLIPFLSVAAVKTVLELSSIQLTNHHLGQQAQQHIDSLSIPYRDLVLVGVMDLHWCYYASEPQYKG